MNDGNAAAAVFGLLHFGNGREQEEHLPVAGRGQAGAEPPRKAELGLLLHGGLFVFPLPAEGGIGEDIVKGLPGKLVIGEGVAVLDEVGVVALDEHIRLADGEGLVVDLLPEGHQLRGGVELVEVFLRHGEHAAGAAGGVVNGLGHVGPGKDVVIVVEQEVHHQADDLPRGVVLPGVLVVRLGEAADDLLENIAHFQVGDHVRVQVGLGSGEFLDDNIQDALARQSGNLPVKAEFLQNIPHVLREAVEIVSEVGLDVVGIVQQPLEGVLAGVVKRLARGGPQQHIPQGQVLDGLVPLQYGILGIGQNTVKAANDGERQDHLAVFVGFVYAGEFIGNRPDQGGFFADVCA